MNDANSGELSVYPFMYPFIIESQNGLVWKGPQSPPIPTPAGGRAAQHQLRLPRVPSNLVLSTSRDGGMLSLYVFGYCHWKTLITNTFVLCWNWADAVPATCSCLARTAPSRITSPSSLQYCWRLWSGQKVNSGCSLKSHVQSRVIRTGFQRTNDLSLLSLTDIHQFYWGVWTVLTWFWTGRELVLTWKGDFKCQHCLGMGRLQELKVKAYLAG